MTRNVFIGIGTNLGDRRRNIEEAIKRLEKIPKLNVIVSSGFFESPAEVTAEQKLAKERVPDFFNAVVEIETAILPAQLLKVLQNIEKEMGRVRSGKKWEPRVIDLDIIFYDGAVVCEDFLKIPHPEAHKRRFVLAPLCEIAPDMIHPLQKKSVSQLLSEL